MNKFTATTIPFSATHQFSELFLDYVSGNKKLESFYTFPANDEGYPAAADQLKYDETIRKDVVAAIREQYIQTGISIDESLIKKLEMPGAMTVCTGHQLCLFTGPLYFIFKIITTIRVAEEQSKKTGKTIVPVYWMATEDHDFDEISSVNLYGKTISWKTEAGGAVGRLRTDSLETVLAELKVVMGVNEAADKLFSIISKAYFPGRTLAQATREFVHTLFGGKVLIIDPDDARLKKHLVPVLKKDVFEHTSKKFVLEVCGKLADAGFAIQVNPRSINVFYMKDNMRERIEEKDGKFHVLNSAISFTKEELNNEMDNYPENFSPNVVLRPMYQQIILPNIAYIGGPGEIAYWLEYKLMFEGFNIPFPLLQPRNFALILEKQVEEKINKLGLQAEDFFGDVEELIKTFVKKISGDSLSMEAEKATIRTVFESLRDKMIAADPTLKGAADAELQKQINGIENLEGKLLKASKQKQETSIAQIRKIREKILPAGMLQERYENFIPFYLKYGERLIAGLSAEFIFPVNGLLMLTEEQ
ncbi:MAG: bacillithiol biosynthesis cysteine-adding enzyme BshC [Bacteroidota bacterium]|nr:bacillithiol biosynthesis cysteine-adding enzyme BshC [Bacteroidota bacterium]